eukprot:scaffold94923_cov32-Tisochrysis_lutea.AAC.1
MANKNIFGLGPGATGTLLGALFFGVYFGSAALARKVIMQDNPNPQRAYFFRDINIISPNSADKQK